MENFKTSRKFVIKFNTDDKATKSSTMRCFSENIDDVRLELYAMNAHRTYMLQH